MSPVLHPPVFVHAAQVLPSLPGMQTPTPLMSWHDCPVLHEPDCAGSHRALHTVEVLPTHARPAPHAASVLPMAPHGSPSVPISSEQAHAPPLASEKHAEHVPGASGLQPARHRPATQLKPSAQLVPLHGWHVPGADEPGRHTLELPVESAAHMFPEPHAVSGHALQNPPMPMPSQHERQYDSALDALSRVQTLQALHTRDTVHGSPVSPRGVHVPPVQV